MERRGSSTESDGGGIQFSSERDKSLTVFVKQSVRRDKRQIYNEWCRTINTLAQGFDGFISTEVIRPSIGLSEAHQSAKAQQDKSSDEYIAILRFNNYSNLQKWITSHERKTMMDRVNEFSDTDPIFSYNSLEYWFTSETGTRSMTNEQDSLSSSNSQTLRKSNIGGPPPRYKMWIVTCVVIYFQVLWVPTLTTFIVPSAKGWNPNLFKLINTVLTVTFSTYIIFPIVTRILTFWLFPSRNYKEAILELVPFRHIGLKIWSSLASCTFLSSQRTTKPLSQSSVSTPIVNDIGESSPLIIANIT